MLDSCCVSIGDLTRDCLAFLKDRQVSSFGCFPFEFEYFVFEIWVVRASVFVFETSMSIDRQIDVFLKEQFSHGKNDPIYL